MNDNQENSIKRLSPEEVTKRLLELLDKCDYELVQENGQRRLTSVKYGPRSKGAEIFLGRLPRDCYEDELVPVLTRIGRVIELRLMMDFSGSTRGYAFALFEHPGIARKACEELNGFEIRPGHRIGVVKSIDNCRLFLGGVPKDKTRADFTEELAKMIDGITNVYVYPSMEDKSLNRGFVFVEFKDHRSAAMARRKLIPGRVMLWDHEVAVDWADPEPGEDVDDEIMQTVTALFVRNLDLDASESDVRHEIQRLTAGIPLMKIKKINHFAFLHYESRAQAQRVLDIIESCIEQKTLEWEISWAKPIRKTEKVHEGLRCGKENNSLKGRTIKYLQKNYSIRNRILKRGNNSSPNESALCHRDRSTAAADCSADSTLKSDSLSPRQKVQPAPQRSVQPDPKIMETVKKDRHDYDNGFQGYNIAPNYIESKPDNQILMPRMITSGEFGEDFPLYLNALEDLAAVYFHANIRCEYGSTDPMGCAYFCNIMLERNGFVIRSYQGNPQRSIAEAFRITVKNAYASLASMLTQPVNYN